MYAADSPGQSCSLWLATAGRLGSWVRDRSRLLLFVGVFARFEASDELLVAGGLPGSVTPVRRQRKQHPGFHELVDRAVHCWFGSIYAGHTHLNCDHGMSRQDVDELPGRREATSDDPRPVRLTRSAPRRRRGHPQGVEACMPTSAEAGRRWSRAKCSENLIVATRRLLGPEPIFP